MISSGTISFSTGGAALAAAIITMTMVTSQFHYVIGSPVGVQRFSGTFWQITDMHYDVNYSSSAVAPSLCRSSEGLRNSSTGGPVGGPYGDYNCDSPWQLVKSAIDAMKAIKPNPDFILWTGDTVAHVPDAYINSSKEFELIRQVVEYLKRTFPNVTIYPILGNHDIWPTDQIPDGLANQYYTNILEQAGFNLLLGSAEADTFTRGGYYSTTLNGRIRLVSVNSNLWYRTNRLFNNVTADPADMFRWLELQMRNASSHGEQVLIVGHIPPGVFGRSNGVNWLPAPFNQRFHRLLLNYSDVIIAAIFGHEHTDGFNIIYNNGLSICRCDVIRCFSSNAPLPPPSKNTSASNRIPRLLLIRSGKLFELWGPYTACSSPPPAYTVSVRMVRVIGDSIRVKGVVANTGVPAVAEFMAPAVSPWFSGFAGSTSNNPGIRLYNYSWSADAASVDDYVQYFINLTAANEANRTDWMREYSATVAYDIPDVGPSSLNDVVVKFYSATNEKLFDRYFLYNSVSKDLSQCIGTCKLRFLCATWNVDYADYDSCVAAGLSGGGPTTPFATTGKAQVTITNGQKSIGLHGVDFRFLGFGVAAAAAAVLFSI